MDVSWDDLAAPALLVATLALLAWRGVRADVVAVLSLAVAVLLGVVPQQHALLGFASPVPVTLATLSVLAVALRGSGIAELPARLLGRRMGWSGVLVGTLGLVAAFLSALSGRSGTQTALLPVVLQSAQRQQRPAGPLLLAVKLACLLGGLTTLVGSAPNLVVSGVRADMLGRGFGVLDFAPAGGTVCLAGLALLAAGWRLVPQRREQPGPDGLEGMAPVEGYTSEVLVPPGSAIVGREVAALEAIEEGGLRVVALVREEYRRILPRPGWTVEANDVLVLACEPGVLQRLMERFGLRIVGGAGLGVNPDRVGVVEAVVTQASVLVGRSPGEGRIDTRGVSLLAIGRSGGQPAGRLRRTKLRAGDILVLQGELGPMPELLAGLGCLPLAERRLRLGRRQQAALPSVVLLAALSSAAAGLVPAWLALLVAVLVLVLSRVLTLSEVYEAVPWPGLVLVGALLPLSAALRDTGGAAWASGLLAPAAAFAGPAASVAAVLLASMGAALLFGGVAAALLLAPVAVLLAASARLSPDALLMGVALGASADMLRMSGTPGILAPMRAGGAGLEWQPGLLLCTLVLVLGTAATLLFWHAR